MGSSISGMEKLLKMPYGCGEQNMINFAPSMFIRAYLETVGQLTPSIKDKSIKFMTSGKHAVSFVSNTALYRLLEISFSVTF